MQGGCHAERQQHRDGDVAHAHTQRSRKRTKVRAPANERIALTSARSMNGSRRRPWAIISSASVVIVEASSSADQRVDDRAAHRTPTGTGGAPAAAPSSRSARRSFRAGSSSGGSSSRIELVHDGHAGGCSAKPITNVFGAHAAEPLGDRPPGLRRAGRRATPPGNGTIRKRPVIGSPRTSAGHSTAISARCRMTTSRGRRSSPRDQRKLGRERRMPRRAHQLGAGGRDRRRSAPATSSAGSVLNTSRTQSA